MPPMLGVIRRTSKILEQELWESDFRNWLQAEKHVLTLDDKKVTYSISVLLFYFLMSVFNESQLIIV